MIPLWAYAGAAIAAVSFGSGWQVRAWKAEADAAKVETALRAAADKQAREWDIAAEVFESVRLGLATQSRETQTVIREYYRNVEVPAECAVPEPVADSLRKAVEGANRAATGEPAPAVP